MAARKKIQKATPVYKESPEKLCVGCGKLVNFKFFVEGSKICTKCQKLDNKVNDMINKLREIKEQNIR